MKLRINPIVVNDLKKIRSFIEEDNEKKAKEVIRNSYKMFENLQLFPYMGSELSKRVSFCTDYKYLVWKNYVILYKVRNNVVEIYRVLNRIQDITRIF